MSSRTVRTLLAASLAVGLTSAYASGSVDHELESQVRVGMTADTVRQSLGQPARAETIRHAAGPTWSYDVSTATNRAVFEIDFDAAGRVAWTGERELLIE